jgi:hypothetical protein
MRRAVKITNKTEFCTRAIRSMILAVARRELKKGEYKNFVVNVGTPKSAFVTGNAMISRHGATASFSLFIPKAQTDMVEVANRVKTCLDYVRGRFGYKDGTLFRDWYERKGKAEDFQYLPSQTLPKAAPKPPKAKGAAAALEGMAKAQERVTHWEGRLRSAETRLKKWRRRLRYYENRSHDLGKSEAAAKEANSMTASEFSKMTPVNEQ